MLMSIIDFIPTHDPHGSPKSSAGGRVSRAADREPDWPTEQAAYPVRSHRISGTARSAPEGGMEVLLRVIEGPQLGEEFVFDRHDTFVVGRWSQAHFSVPEDGF